MDTDSGKQAWLSSAIDDAAARLHASGDADDRALELPDQDTVVSVLRGLIDLLMPGGVDAGSVDAVRSALNGPMTVLAGQIDLAFQYKCDVEDCPESCACRAKSRSAIEHVLQEFPRVHELMQLDILAAYEGDPAAKSTREVVLSYPCIQAIATHRIAHTLYQAEVPLIGRIMSEWAHSQTGIDIHPGATIGSGFFIDHGTGVVIGETCEIGERVKLYQGVTLGALSFEKDDEGNLVKGIKRHPNVGDHVTIYAGATILGGETTIGEGSVIGGNVWLIHSVPPGSRVYNQQPSPKIQNTDESA